MNQENSNLRYERKYIIPSSSKYLVKHIVNSSDLRFYRQFEERIVNSIYLDDSNLSFYFENINGDNIRKKIRIRWYGCQDFIKHPRLEIKKKNNKLGDKIIHNLEDFEMPRSRNIINNLIDFLVENKFPKELIYEINNLQPTLFVSYKRNYYISKRIDCRVTFDEDISYERVNNKSIFDVKSHAKEHTMIMEIKYPPNIEDHHLTFLEKLPFRLSKNSKYINGTMNFIKSNN